LDPTVLGVLAAVLERFERARWVEQLEPYMVWAWTSFSRFSNSFSHPVVKLR
jgi:hypothetical protein